MFTDIINPEFPVLHRQRLFDIAVQGFDKATKENKELYIQMIFNLMKPNFPQNWSQVAKEAHAKLLEETLKIADIEAKKSEEVKSLEVKSPVEVKKAEEATSSVVPASVIPAAVEKPVYVAPAPTENSKFLNALIDIEAQFKKIDPNSRGVQEARVLFLFHVACQLSFYEFSEERNAEMGSLFKRMLTDNVDPTAGGDSSYNGYVKSLLQYIGEQINSHQEALEFFFIAQDDKKLEAERLAKTSVDSSVADNAAPKEAVLPLLPPSAEKKPELTPQLVAQTVSVVATLSEAASIQPTPVNVESVLTVAPTLTPARDNKRSAVKAEVVEKEAAPAVEKEAANEATPAAVVQATKKEAKRTAKK